jgi:hypothetical protein
MKMPRSRTEVAGLTESRQTRNGVRGSWCCRRADVHHNSSVLEAFSCKRLAEIQHATSSKQMDIRDCSRPLDEGELGSKSCWSTISPWI